MIIFTQANKALCIFDVCIGPKRFSLFLFFLSTMYTKPAFTGLPFQNATLNNCMININIIFHSPKQKRRRVVIDDDSQEK